MRKKTLTFVLAFALLFVAFSASASTAENANQYKLGTLRNAGKDTGYSKNIAIDSKDPHHGWKLGEFYVSGFTRQIVDGDTPIFLKNVGDEVTLWFDLQQNINALNGDEKLYICEDVNGYEETLEVKQQNLKKGALIIKHTDYQNKDGLSQIYIDFLSANTSENANTQVLLCEEGDYEVSLLYEIKDDNFLFFDSYYNYRIDFKFSVRNGNSMVFPFDVVTGQELTNSVFTENGFRIDLANSHYLNVDIKREVLNEGVDGLVEDIRFNRPAADGEEFTEEGIYTITVTNQYTNVTTEKKIYVGTNSLLKAYVVTGLSIEEINAKLADGKTEIDSNGNIVPLKLTNDAQNNTQNDNADNTDVFPTPSVFIIGATTLGILIVLVVVILVLKKKKASSSITEKDT